MRASELVNLQEGIKYFKDSKRVYSYITKLEKKIAGMQGIDEGSKNKVETYIGKLKTLAEKLTEIEDKYEAAKEERDRFSIKNEYKRVKVQNMALFKELDNDTLKKALIGTGAIFGVLAIMGIIGGSGVFINKDQGSFLDSNGKIDTNNLSRVVNNTEAVKRELESRANSAASAIAHNTYVKEISDAQLKNINDLIDKARNVNKVGMFGWNNALGFL
jgi:hypothetical protein